MFEIVYGKFNNDYIYGRYTLENPLEWFEINQNTGDISAISALDREHVSVDQPTSQYLLKVIANDDGKILKNICFLL